jgi:anaerobic dimethyl sulfoxide reductase subunit A
VNQYPYTKRWHEALTSDKIDFIVVQEQFMSATARYADIVLPSSTALERNDIVATGDLTPFYGYLRKIIEPLYESKSHVDIARALADRLGIDDSYFKKTDEELARQFAEEAGISFHELEEKGIIRVEEKEPYVAFRKQIEDPDRHPFPTPSGKIEIYSAQLAALNDPLIPPIPKYIEPWEGRNDPLAKKYPLQLITLHLYRRAHSQYELIPWLREHFPQELQINSIDAESRNIHDGDQVQVSNDRGRIVLSAHVTERIMPGVVGLPQGAWYTPDEKGNDKGACMNTLMSNRHSPVGALVTNTALVQVERA